MTLMMMTLNSRLFFRLFFFLELAVLPSCHYQFGHGQLASQYRTISIPYVEGDRNGNLTAEIIKKISTSGAFVYAQSGGELQLNVKILGMKDRNIGFRYDRKRDEKIKHSIIPAESRYTLIAEVSILDTVKNEIVRGPTQMTAKLDFDYDYYKVQHGVNVFSLGQVNDVDSARDAARVPLDSKLADLIVEYVVSSW